MYNEFKIVDNHLTSALCAALSYWLDVKRRAIIEA